LESQIKFATIGLVFSLFMLTDTHSHIHFLNEFPDVDSLIQRAEAAQVDHQVIVGCTPNDSYEALDFVKKRFDKHMWSTLGVHPHSANLYTDEVEQKFRTLILSEPKIVALGELGLDYFRNLQPKELQVKTFTRQLVLAKELNKAVVVHVRDAWEDALKILGEVGNTKVILHCFTGDIVIAQECWSRGYYLSFSGVVTYPKNGYIRDVALSAPLEQILIETDCPYLTPQLYRGKRNEPAYVVETAKLLAGIKGMSLEQFGKMTTQNAQRIFGWVE
jgi:TatD DNase family protein